jgi:hypothetical protein
VQQATQQPLTEHLLYAKGFVEDLARIWLDIMITYNDSIQLEEEQTDPATGETYIVLIDIQKATLQALQASVKVDITPKGAFDRYAQEQSMENLLTAGMFSTERMPELKLYVKTLDDDSVMPKQKLETLVEEWDKEQQRIAMIQSQAQILQQRAQQFLMEDPDGQAQQIADARMMLQMQQQEQPIKGEAEVKAAEKKLKKPKVKEK